MPPGEMSDEELCRGVAQGRRDCFTELFDRHYRAIHGFCLLKAGESEAKDAAQETFVALWRDAGSFTGRSTFKGWLFGIAFRKCMDTHRRKPDKPIHPSEPIETPGFDDALAVRQAIRGLPEGLREAVFLVYYRGFSYEEAAGVLGIPVGTVRSRLHTARGSLLKALNGWEVSRTG